MKYKFVILGAGINGLTIAYELAKVYPGNVVLIEKESQVGGMARTISKNGYRYDLGSHRIHIDVPLEVLRWVHSVLGKCLITNTRGGKLRFASKYIDYPVKILQFMSALGCWGMLTLLVSFAKSNLARLIGNTSKDFEQTYEGYLKSRVGAIVYSRFYEPYAKKVFGIQPLSLSKAAVQKRISLLKPLHFMQKKALIACWRRKPQYYYFTHGIGELAAGLEDGISKNQVLIIKGVKELSINGDGGMQEVSYLCADGQEGCIQYDKLVSTIPIDELSVKLQIKNHRERGMWRGLRVAYLHINGDPAMDGETFYFPELSYLFGRVSIPKRFSSHMQPANGYTSYVCEVPCSVDDDLWSMIDKQFCEICFEGLIQAELISADSLMNTASNFTVKLPEAYPVYSLDWENSFFGMISKLTQDFPNIYSSGRLGLFLHCNLDSSIVMGKRLAEGLLRGVTVHEWYENIPEFQTMMVRD